MAVMIHPSDSKDVPPTNNTSYFNLRLDSAIDSLVRKVKQVGNLLKLSPNTSTHPKIPRKKHKWSRSLSKSNSMKKILVQVEAKRVISKMPETSSCGEQPSRTSENELNQLNSFALDGHIILTAHTILFEEIGSRNHPLSVSSTSPYSVTSYCINLPLKGIHQIIVKQLSSDSSNVSNQSPSVGSLDHGDGQAPMENNQPEKCSILRSAPLEIAEHSVTCSKYHLEIHLADSEHRDTRDAGPFLFCMEMNQLDEVVACLQDIGVEVLLNVSQFDSSNSPPLKRQDTCVWEVLELCEPPDRDEDKLLEEDIASVQDGEDSGDEDINSVSANDFDMVPFSKPQQLNNKQSTSCSDFDDIVALKDFSELRVRKARHTSISSCDVVPGYRVLNYSFRYNEADYPDPILLEDKNEALVDIDTEVIKRIDEERFVPELLGDVTSDIITYSMLAELSPYFPPPVCGCDLSLAYSANHHGFSLRSIYRHMLSIPSQCLLLIEDDRQTKFGAFLSMPIKLSPRFYGDSTCFVFRWAPNLEVFLATGKNAYFIKGNLNSVVIGANNGRNAIWIEEGLLYGQSDYTETFDNPTLCANESGSFTIKSLEIWKFESSTHR